MTDSLERLQSALAERYTLERRLGEGGMATVYLAVDPKHDRQVAVKVLRPELAAVLGHERFVQEIKTTAHLQHPHILPLFDSGEADGFLYYVMPYVEGETLRDRLDRETQLGVEEAVRITTEVADALEYAHRHDVIHRDVKPENILLQEGRPMVADFGIALAVSAAAGGRMTETGLSLGTPHYMSPEQATAEKHISHRSDIYSLACVLYEMLAGDPPHTGSSVHAIILKIVTEEAAPVDRLRKTVPTNVAAAVSMALEKLPADRFESVQAFADALQDPHFTTSSTATPVGHVAGSDSRWRRRFIAAACAAVVLLGTTILALLPSDAPAPVVRQHIVLWDRLPGGLAMLRRNATIAPDGSAIVYRAMVDGHVQLVKKNKDRLSTVPIAGTEGAVGPFFSPDGAWLGFFADGALRKVPASGGAPLTLADHAQMELPGGAWTEDGTVYFVGTIFDLRRVDASGGNAEVVASFLEQGVGVGSPWPLPDGRGVLFSTANADFTELDGYVYDARSDTVRLVIPGGAGVWYAPEGHLLYGGRDGGLFAAPFDLDRLEITGPAVPVVDGLLSPELTFSRDGTALYVLGQPGLSGPSARLVWVDRGGHAEPIDPGWTFRPGDANWGMALSPDASRIALRIAGDMSLATDIWIKPLPAGPLSRLTFGTGERRMPRWSPDGRFVTFVSTTDGGTYDLMRMPSDGTAQKPELLLDYERPLAQGFYGPKGEWLILRTLGSGYARGGRDILGFRPGRDSVPVPLVVTENDEQAPAVSPDGRWLAYLSDETGRNEVFVRPFPDTDGGKVQVSEGGAYAPLWAHDGTELFYVGADNEMILARVDPGPPFTVRERRALFTLPPGCARSPVQGYYDITPDDQRFLMRRTVQPTDSEQVDTRQLILVQNWFDELREKVGG